MVSKKELGAFGEEYAEKYLVKQNYDIIDKNYTVGRLGEIDIIALNNEYICFIEVKTRSQTFYGSPSESVHFKKQQKIRQLALGYLQYKKINFDIRFDVIEVFVNINGKEIFIEDINHIENAF